MLGYITTTDILGQANMLLDDLARQLAAEGARLAGAVQINKDNGADCTCDMDLRILGDGGPSVRISQSLGRESQACRLDAGALEIAVARVETVLAGGADLLVLNKFSKQEAMGKGFRDIIAAALERGIPVLTCVSSDHINDFNTFVGDLAQPLAYHQAGEWCRDAIRKARAA